MKRKVIVCSISIVLLISLITNLYFLFGSKQKAPEKLTSGTYTASYTNANSYVLSIFEDMKFELYDVDNHLQVSGTITHQHDQFYEFENNNVTYTFMYKDNYISFPFLDEPPTETTLLFQKYDDIPVSFGQ